MTSHTDSRDYRLVAVALFGLSGLTVLFSTVFRTSVVVAIPCGAVAVVAGLLIAGKALRPWQGSGRDQKILLGFAVLQFLAVSALVALLR